ncbi:MAG: HAD-IB family phosphatase [Anaerovoracaceae bacterium]|jgi:2-hydroxy-3-keto-5-methylthiopentenyl-1-phosphate phosphatase
MKYENIIFLDFDGTVTCEETLSGAMMRVIPASVMAEYSKKLRNREISLTETLHAAFDTMDSEKLGIMLDYYSKVPLRDHFGEFLDLAEKLGIPVVLLSGGLEPFVEATIKPFRDKFLDVYYVKVDMSGGKMKLISDHEGDGYLLMKDEVMKNYDYDHAIAVGDGITDVEMAKASDLVFARDDLAKAMDAAGGEYVPWEDFGDIIAELKRRFGR